MTSCSAELKQAGIDLRAYFRDRLSRCLRERFGEVPWFLFVSREQDEVREVHSPASLPRVDRDTSFAAASAQEVG